MESMRTRDCRLGTNGTLPVSRTRHKTNCLSRRLDDAHLGSLLFPQGLEVDGAKQCLGAATNEYTESATQLLLGLKGTYSWHAFVKYFRSEMGHCMSPKNDMTPVDHHGTARNILHVMTTNVPGCSNSQASSWTRSPCAKPITLFS